MQETNSERSSTERRFRSKLQREQQETQQLQAREEKKAKQMKKMPELVEVQVQLLEMAGSGSRPELLYLPLTDLPMLILTEPTVSLERTTKVVVSSDLRSQEPRKRPKRQKALAETTKVEPASVVDLLAESQEKLMQPRQTQVSPEPASRRKRLQLLQQMTNKRVTAEEDQQAHRPQLVLASASETPTLEQAEVAQEVEEATVAAVAEAERLYEAKTSPT
jgi:hypothetical protein